MINFFKLDLKFGGEVMQELQNLAKGNYVLVLRLNEEKIIEIGSLGKFRFSSGYYAYIGSAFNKGGLTARLGHHFGPAENPHWHIDYLNRHAEISEVWYSETDKNMEHEWANRMLEMPEGIFFINGFGSSDCNCIGHLFYFREAPELGSFKKHVMKSAGSGRADIKGIKLKLKNDLMFSEA